jgi:hypothetical protein
MAAAGTRLWTGSVAADIAASTTRPVCVTSEKALANGRRFGCHRILCVLTLEGSDDPVVLHAEALANRFRGELRLLHVVPELSGALLHTESRQQTIVLCPKVSPLSASGNLRHASLARTRHRWLAVRLIHQLIEWLGSTVLTSLWLASRHRAVQMVPASICEHLSGCYRARGFRFRPRLRNSNSSWKEPPRDVLHKHKHKTFVSPSARLVVHFAAAPGCCTSTRAAYPGHCIRPLESAS